MKSCGQRLTALCVFGILSLAMAGCGSKTAKTDNAPKAAAATEDSSDLTLQESQSRKARLKDVQYQLAVQIPASGPEFTGFAQIQFELSDVAAPLRLDFFEGKVIKATANGQTLAAEAKKKYWIEVPGSALKVGHNVLTVDYSHEFSHQGQGLHQFIDPETKEAFLYTQFETFDANRFMPCFDQPDLRATLELRVNVPAKWQVISTTRESSVKPAAAGRKLWTFPTTAPIATYLFSLHAGPYKVWKDSFQDIPLRLFARPSMAKYVNAKEWFKWTKEGLQFYNGYFNYPYPFKKYDQLLVPDFNAGAMENVAAVTFREGYLSRSTMTRAQRRNLASTLLHEMAHMWFGDVVTMKWWNNLWLNESFATFMEALCLDQATEFKESWQDFFASEKTWAYWEDGLVTTHPIEAPIHSVKDAFANFDGITYGKGASVLKQLWAYMGPVKFEKGIAAYIHSYAFKNADLQDFIDTLQTQTDKDLNVWAARWLRQAGADKLTAKWSCQGNDLTTVELTATPKVKAQFRPQAVELALFQGHDGKLAPPTVVRVEMTSATQTVTGKWACPNLVYPNYQDYGYAQVKLDPVSLDYAKNNLGGVSDPLLRSQLWADLWQMVRDTEMPLQDYVQIVNKHFPGESDEIVQEQIVGTLSGRRGEGATVLNYWPARNDQDKASRVQFVGSIEAQYLKRFNDAKAGSDDQKLWFDAYVSLAQTPDALKRLAKWFHAAKVGPGLTLDLDRRWRIVRQLARYEQPDAKKFLAEMKKKDNSERGQKGALASEAIAPDFAVKQKWVDIVKQPKPSLPFPDVRAVLGSLFPIEQKELAKLFENDYYDYLRKNGSSEDELYVETVAAMMAPLSCDAQSSSKMQSFLSNTKGFAPTVSKALKVDLQEDERCQKIRAFGAL